MLINPHHQANGCQGAGAPKKNFHIIIKVHTMLCKKKAWFDEVNMLNWVKNVLAPDVAKFSTGIIPQFV
jgi:hypothetical protein